MDTNISEAHEFFRNATDAWLDVGQDDRQARVDSLQRVLTDLLHLVVIDLTADDNPHVIFESLNARGEKLLESDLIKNMVMYEADRDGVATGTQDGRWLWDFNDRWWVKEVGRGRLRQPRIDIFLHHWLTMRTAKRVLSDDVFLSFRRYYDDEKVGVVQVATDLQEIGEIYRPIETESLADERTSLKNLDLFLYRKGILQNTVVVPVLLWLFSSVVPDEQLMKALRALESHMVRRMILLESTIAHNNTFVEMVGELHNCDPDKAGDEVVKFLREKDSTVAAWPTDSKLMSAMLNNDLYRGLTRRRLRLVLEGIEQGLRTGMAEEQNVHRKLTVEHLMPQNWRDNYPLPNHVDAEDRDRTIHTIGNLTLVNQPLNSSMNNAPWVRKRLALRNHSTLFLNKDVALDNCTAVWTEEEIRERARRLFDAAIEVWPYADNL